MEGMGVLLNYLRGNEDSVAAWRKALGRTITAISLGEDEALHLTMDETYKFKAGRRGAELL